MNEKLCSKCKAVKPTFEFYANKSNRSGLSSICKSCQKEISTATQKANKKKYAAQQKAWRERNPERWAALQRKHKEALKLKRQEERKRRKRAQTLRDEWMADYLKSHPCVDCGEDDILVLEFDHCDPDIKEYDIAKIRKSGSFQKLVDEILKCDVLCANCHKRRTAKQCDSWRLKFI